MEKITVKNASERLIRDIAYEYVSSQHATFESLSDRYRLSPKMISNLLYRGIADNILDDTTADKVFNKVVYIYPNGQFQRMKRWEEAFSLRDEKREEERHKKNQHQEQIAELESHIASYDSYAIEEDGAPTKDDLIRKLNALRSVHC